MSPIFNRTFSPAEVVANFGVPDLPMMKRAFPPDLPLDEREAAHERYFAAYHHAHTNISAFEGVTELLESLQTRGVPLGIMTGKGRRACDITLDWFGWREWFGSVVTGDDVAHQKPHPEGVLRVARELNVAPNRCVWVGDSPADLEAGLDAGMFSVVAGWHSFYHDELRQRKPDLWADSPLELRDFLVDESV